MSQYIPNFLYEPIARQARRFSSPNTAETAEQRGTRHGTLVGVPEPSMAGQAEEASGPIAGGDQYVASILGQPVMLSPTTASGGLEAELRGLQPHEAFNSSWNRNATVVSDQYTAIVRTDSNSEGVLPQADSDVINNPTRRFTERFRSTNTSISSSINDTGLTNSRSPGTSRRNTTQDGNSASAGTYAVDGVLPEDDGMRTMRNKILQIQSRDISNHEKSRLMHELMTHQYSSYHPNLLLHAIPRARSPNSIRSQDRPLTPNSYLSISDTMQSSLPQTSASSIADREDICQVTSEDIKPTYWIPQARTATADDSSELMVPEQTTNSGPQESYNDQEMPLGCAHYKRNVKLQCSACFRWYTCRFCHDAVEDHSLNRRETKSMLCMLCGCAQAAAGDCKDCGNTAANYYCGICKLWEDDPNKSIYHCNDCGICRIGEGLGRDFYHCKTCCVCLSIIMKDSHKCIERSIDCDCPICGEYMFTSLRTVVFMRCGHSIHRECYNEHVKTSYRCPICSRSMLNMEMQFRNLDRAIESQPMPEQFQDTKAWVYCNDCSAKTEVKYHWLGLKCAVCDSYNTAQISITGNSRTNRGASPDELIDTHMVENADLLLPEAVQTFSGGQPAVRSGMIRRPATSEIALDALRIRPSEVHLRDAHSASPSAASWVVVPNDGMQAEVPTDLMDVDGGNDDNEDDVDFWGGESPRERALSTQGRRDAEEMDGSEDESEDDDDDEIMDDDSEDDEDDHMDIFGHR